MDICSNTSKQERNRIVCNAARAVVESVEARVLFAFSAVTTFESTGLYWSPTGGGSAVQAGRSFGGCRCRWIKPRQCR